jgi:hypothetical protein
VPKKREQCAFGLLNAEFKIYEGPICCKEDTVNSVVKASVVLHNFIRTQEGSFGEGTQNYTINQSSHHILN